MSRPLPHRGATTANTTSRGVPSAPFDAKPPQRSYSDTWTRTSQTPRTPRKLILCFDGTSNKPMQYGTTVGRMFFNLDKSEAAEQICYYQPGIGTYVPPSSPFAWLPKKVVTISDLALARFLEEHIVGGYRFLMSNYREDDQIIMFGFSRGAYTCRALAAMLSCVGLLSKDNEELIHFAYKLYRESGTQGPHKAAAFRSKVSRSVKVNFLGVWDTVASVGLAGTTLPSALSLGVIQHYRQALALDEHRAKFIQNSLYLTPDDISWNQAASVPKPYAWDTGRFRRIFRVFTLSTVSAKEQLGPSPNARDKSDCTYRDVWFVGNHNDVGGSPKSGHVCHLSNISLLWMMRELHKAGILLHYKENAFRPHSALSLQATHPQLGDAVVANLLVQEQDKRSSILSKTESLSPALSDQVFEATAALEKDIMESEYKDSLSWPWYPLEMIPTWQPFMDKHGRRCKRLSVHWGSRRRIEHQDPTFHWSVALHLTRRGYKVKADYCGAVNFTEAETISSDLLNSARGGLPPPPCGHQPTGQAQ